MGKDKLRRFAENLTFECFVQPAFEEAFRRDHPLKGHWHSDFFHNDRPIVLELGCGKGEYTVALAERDPNRNPAIILADGVIGQMMEKVVLPAQKPRRTDAEVIEQCPWATTGRTNGRKPNVITSLELKPEEMEKNNIRFQAKYKEIEENEVRFEEIHCEDAEYLIVAFGSMARIGQKAMEMAREEGLKVGMLRPITLWPFPTKAIAAYADKVKGMLVTELNAGQMIEDVRLAVNGKVKVEHFGRLGGIVPDPDEIVEALAKLKIEG
jgi:2-oxoglutarate ferredoxin oxidoreductase subunit alpha